MITHKILTRKFILVFLGQFSLSFTYHLLIPTLPIYLSNRGSNEKEIGILIGALSVSSLALRPFVGKALLRSVEKNFMLGGAVLFTLSSLAYLFAPPFWPLFVVRIVQGAGVAFFFTASVTFVANISPEIHRGQSLGYYFLSHNLAFALAPSLGMVLINSFGFTLLFLFCTVLSMCSFYFSTRLGKEKTGELVETGDEDNVLLSFKALPLAVMCFFIHIIWGAVAAFFPLFAIGHDVKNPGLFFGAYGATLIAGRSLGGKIMDRYSRESIMLPCLTTYVLAMIVLAFSKTLPMFILGAVIWGTGNAFLFPVLTAYTIERAGSSRGPAMATFTAVGDLGVGLGSVLMGLVLYWTGSYPIMFLCLSFTGLINFFYFYAFVRHRGKNR